MRRHGEQPRWTPMLQSIRNRLWLVDRELDQIRCDVERWDGSAEFIRLIYDAEFKLAQARDLVGSRPQHVPRGVEL